MLENKPFKSRKTERNFYIHCKTDIIRTLLHILKFKEIKMRRSKNNTVPYKCVSSLQSLQLTINSYFIYLLSCRVSSVTVSYDKTEKVVQLRPFDYSKERSQVSR